MSAMYCHVQGTGQLPEGHTEVTHQLAPAMPNDSAVTNPLIVVNVNVYAPWHN